MLSSEVFVALHLGQSRQTTFKLKFQLPLRIKGFHRHFCRNNQFDVTLVELVHQRNKASRGIIYLTIHLLYVCQQYRVVDTR